jgi:hypothetical protein
MARKRDPIGQTRGFLYGLARRVTGKASGRFLGKLFPLVGDGPARPQDTLRRAF